jgi:hypothetical protein
MVAICLVVCSVISVSGGLWSVLANSFETPLSKVTGISKECVEPCHSFYSFSPQSDVSIFIYLFFCPVMTLSALIYL